MVRSKLLITIGILYVAAVVSIGVYAVRSSYEVGGRAASDARPAEPSECTRWLTVRTTNSGLVFDGFETYDSQADAEEAARRERASGIYAQVEVECRLISVARERVPARAAVPPETRYESETITTSLVVSTLAMAIAVGGVLVWARPTSTADVQGSASPFSPAEGSPPRDLDDGIVESSEAADEPASIGTTATARVAESLRQLKTLHDEGILTDDEYETKRKALTDQL